MNSDHESQDWKFSTFGLFVTGKGEEEFLPVLFRSLTESGNCTFRVLQRIPQLSPITSQKRILRMVGTGKYIPNSDEEKIGLPARRFLEKSDDRFLILIDDLEHDRRDSHEAIFDRYSKIFDTFLTADSRPRSSVHFFVNMLEAYYFADTRAVNMVLETELQDFQGDVELIRHPKNDLKKLQGVEFDAKAHGREIVKLLNLERILSNSATCRSLRSLIKWCVAALSEPFSDKFMLLTGQCCAVTEPQIAVIEKHMNSGSS